jgi:hypothetical protein
MIDFHSRNILFESFFLIDFVLIFGYPKSNFLSVFIFPFPVESKKITPSIIENLEKNCKRKDGCAGEKIVL